MLHSVFLSQGGWSHKSMSQTFLQSMNNNVMVSGCLNSLMRNYHATVSSCDFSAFTCPSHYLTIHTVSSHTVHKVTEFTLWHLNLVGNTYMILTVIQWSMD